MLKKAVWITTIVILALIYWFNQDDPLNENIPRVLAKINAEVSSENNGMVYLLGMWAKEPHEPYTVGMNRLENYQTYTQQSDFSEKAQQLEHPNSSYWLNEPDFDSDNPIQCRLREPACVQTLWNNRSAFSSYLQEYSLYLERVSALMRYEEFVATSTPNLFSPLVFHQATQFAIKLKLMQIMLMADQGEYLAASAELSRLIGLNIRILENSPDIITKVMFLVFQEVTLDVASFLLANTPIANSQVWEKVSVIASTIDPEKASIHRQQLFEFVAIVNSIKQSQAQGQWGVDLSSDEQTFPSSLLYKPNKTFNLLYEQLVINNVDYQWKDDEISRINNQLSSTKEVSIQPTNIVGSILARTALPRKLQIDSNIVELYFLHRQFLKSYDLRIRGIIPTLNQMETISPYTGSAAFLNNERLCVEGEEREKESANLCIFF